ncbi:MAG: MBL fold metallo-hydrolase [Acidobacteria bacterium]|nr:MBL fold metallo-hydrolase [Acidobacteriota bacterium]
MRNGRKLALALVVLVGTAAAQQQVDWEKVEIKAQKVAGSVYMLTGRGGNIGVSVGDDGIVVMDTQFAPLASKIQAALKGITDKPVRFVLNTHWHGDHTGGNAGFSKLGTLVAHENVRKRLESGGQTRFGKTPPQPPAALPIITFNDQLVVHLNGEEIRAIHFPHSHTDGDIAIGFKPSGVLHMGDLFFNGLFPFIDVDSGGSIKGLIATIERVLALNAGDAKIIPGHGPLGTRADLAAYLEMLRGTSGAVEAAIKKGKTLEQMKQEKVLAAWEDKWGKGFLTTNDFIDILYAALTQKPSGYHNHGHADEKSGGR